MEREPAPRRNLKELYPDLEGFEREYESHAEREKWEEAANAAQRQLARLEEIDRETPGHPDFLDYLGKTVLNLAEAHHKRGGTDEASGVLQEAIDRLERKIDEDRYPEQTVPMLRAQLGFLRKMNEQTPYDPKNLLKILQKSHELAQVLFTEGHLDEALSVIGEARKPTNPPEDEEEWADALSESRDPSSFSLGVPGLIKYRRLFERPLSKANKSVKKPPLFEELTNVERAISDLLSRIMEQKGDLVEAAKHQMTALQLIPFDLVLGPPLWSNVADQLAEDPEYSGKLDEFYELAFSPYLEHHLEAFHQLIREGSLDDAEEDALSEMIMVLLNMREDHGDRELNLPVDFGDIPALTHELVDAYVGQGKIDEAISLLEKLIEGRDPVEGGSREELALTQEQAEHAEKRLKELREMRDSQ